MSPLIEIRDVRKYFPVRKGPFRRKVGEVKAVDGVSIDIDRGKTLGVVGESGCGKSTLARILVGLIEPSSGEIRFDGKKLGTDEEFQPSHLIQIIFQDPYSSLDPRVPVGTSIGEGLAIHRMGSAAERRKAVIEMLELVGLGAHCADRYPHEFSGGQRQRIGIARALVMKPAFIVCDEPTSALDVSVQAQILNLLQRLQKELDLTLMFISHNLAVVRHVADRLMVMYLGRVVEVAPAGEIFDHPRHPYTQALLSATPLPDPTRKRNRIKLEGELPSALNPPSGCPFHPRCPLANERCRIERPELLPANLSMVACHAVSEGRAESQHIFATKSPQS
jgi:oligopeptide/dipeptide ABC transporter ATP-binding protein